MPIFGWDRSFGNKGRWNYFCLSIGAMDNGEEELELMPFYLRKKRVKKGDGMAAKEDGCTLEETSCYKKQFKLGKFCLSVAETAKGLEYWSGLRMRDINSEKLWAFHFDSAKVGMNFGENTSGKKNRFTATPLDFEVFVTHLIPLPSYIKYLAEAADRVVEKYKSLNNDLQPHDLPRGVSDVSILAEMKTDDGVNGRLVQKVDTFLTERNYQYMMSTTGCPPNPKHLSTAGLSITIRYVRISETDGSSIDSPGMYFTMPFDEYLALCRNPEYLAFCKRIEAEMPVDAYDNVRLETIKCNVSKQEEAKAKAIPDELVVMLDSADDDLPSTQE